MPMGREFEIVSAEQPFRRGILFQALGAPSSLTYTCCALIRAMADIVYGRHALIQAVFVDDVKNGWAQLERAATTPIVLFSDCPSKGLVDLVVSTRLPFVVVVDDFEETAHQVMEARDMALPEMLRFVTQAYCSLDAGRGDAALVVSAGDGRRGLREVMTRLAEHFGLDAPNETSARTLAALGYPAGATDTLLDHVVASGLRVTSPASRAARADAEAEAIVRLVASQYNGVGSGRGGRRIEWPTEMFLDWDRPGQFLRGPVEMLGPARFVVCGPYFHLPQGEWTAEVVIEIADNRSGNRLGVDVFSGAILGGVVMALPASGVFTFSIPFGVADAFLPVELRFQLLEGAIEGQLALRAAAFTRIAPAAGEVEARAPAR